jgi:phospholipid-binding lipoprotein MlaA
MRVSGRRRCGRLFLIAAVVAISTATATSGARAGTDYLETVNRQVFAFNQAFYSIVLDPLSLAYDKSVPQPLKRGISNFLANIREPLTVISSGLQGEFYNAGDATTRFAINSTIGVAGIFDIATEWRIFSRPEDLGQVLCHYEMPEGPFLVLPFFGPATSRDTLGIVGTVGVFTVAIGGLTVPYLATDGSIAYFDADRTAHSAARTGEDYYQSEKNAYLAQRDAACRNDLDVEVSARSQAVLEGNRIASVQ